LGPTARATATIPGRRWGARASFLDNLIAAGKAKPMVVVMPAGHTSQTTRFSTMIS
jgi:enterochelin esterase-like enzyme